MKLHEVLEDGFKVIFEAEEGFTMHPTIEMDRKLQDTDVFVEVTTESLGLGWEFGSLTISCNEMFPRQL